MGEGSFSRRGYQLVALATLPLPVLATHALGPSAAELVPSDSSLTSLLTLLAYLLVLLGCVLVWGILLLPLRRRAGFEPIAEELARMRAEGGFRQAVAKERRALDRRMAADDPAYHSSFALVGLLLTLPSAALAWALWNDGYVLIVALAMVLVCPSLALHHAIQWLRLRGRGAGRSRGAPPPRDDPHRE